MSPPIVNGSILPREPSPATAEPSIEDLLAALPERLERIPCSRAFRIRLALCALVLIALLLAYLGLVVVTSYGLWSHVASPRVVAAVHRLIPNPLLYGFLCVSGVILCVFLVKPLFTLRGARPPQVRLERSAEPRLFAFVDRLCEAQGAPAPKEILVDTQVNASASLRHGLIGLFRDDLTLTIGLPLATGLSLREFTGVLAHEFGHFTQGGAMRLSSLIHRSVRLMLRIVHERDGFDAALIEAGAVRVFLDPRLFLLSLAFSLAVWTVLAFLWVARMMLKGLAWLGMASAVALLREMEFDADAHEVRVVGREGFVKTGDRLLVLETARATAAAIEQRSWEARRLPDDLPRLVAILAERISAKPELLENLREEAQKKETQPLDTHPSFRDRMAAARAVSEAGTFPLDAPAATLFRDLPALSRESTLVFYRDLLDMEFGAARFLPVPEILYEIEGDPTVTQRLTRLTQGCPTDACRLTFGTLPAATPLQEPTDVDATIRELEDARRRILELAPTAHLAAARLAEARNQLDRYGVVAALLKTGFPVDPGPILANATPNEAVAEGRRRSVQEIQRAEQELIPFSEAVLDRLRIALRLIPTVELESTDQPLPTDREAMVATLRRLGAARTHVELLRSRLALLFGIFRESQLHAGNPLAVRPMIDAAEEVRKTVQGLRSAIDDADYPFPFALPAVHKDGTRPTLGVFLGNVLISRDPGQAYSQGADLLSRLGRLEDRILSTIAEMAERVETSLGWSPLPDPPVVENVVPAGVT
ncbi:MAG: M48 family metallopeptidase [Isosphaeraceae bacterium]